MNWENDTLTKGSLFERVALQSWLTNDSWLNGKSYEIRICIYGIILYLLKYMKRWYGFCINHQKHVFLQVKRNEIDSMWQKWLYVIGWSAALLVATLPALFKGNLSFSLQGLVMREVCEKYMFPMVMALALLMADVLYSAEQEKAEMGRVRNSSTLVICTMAFLFSFIFSMWLEIPWLCWTCFVVAWLSMTFLKFSRTLPIGGFAIPEGQEVPD